MTITMATMLQAKAYVPEKATELRVASEGKDMITDFNDAMDAQLAFITEYINNATEEELTTEVDLFGTGNAMAIETYFLNILFKNYPAYRMQLFHYMKDGLGMKDLNTSNLWMGQDPA